MTARLGLGPLGERGAATTSDEEDEDDDGESEENDAADREAAQRRTVKGERAFARAAQFDRAGFDPAQPRAPAGNPDGGQWSGGGGGTTSLIPATVRKLLDPTQRPEPILPGAGGGAPSRGPSTPATPSTASRPRVLEPRKPMQGQTEGEVKRAQAELDRIHLDAKRTSGQRSPIYDKNGGSAQARADFDSLPHVGDVRVYNEKNGPAYVKQLPDGRYATFREKSNAGPTTVDINGRNPDGHVKYRYR